MKHQKTAAALREALKSHYKGPEEIVDVFLSGVISQSKILLYCSHGKGKSMLAEAVGHLTGTTYARVQGSVGLMESRMIARYDIAQLIRGKEEIKWRDFVKAKIKHLDEINRTPPVLLNSIFSMLQERKVEFGDEWLDLDGFVFIGTMNPADSATYEMPPPLVDRFDLCILLPSVRLSDKKALIDIHDFKPVAKEEDLEAMNKEIQNVSLGDDIKIFIDGITRDLQLCIYGDKEFLVDFPQCCSECRHKEWICSKIDSRWAVGERIGLSLKKISRAYAYIQGREAVEKKDVLALMKYVLYHRVKMLDTFTGKHHSLAASMDAMVHSMLERDAERIDAYRVIKDVYYGDYDKMDILKEHAKNDMLIDEFYQEIKTKFDSQQGMLEGRLKGKSPKELEAMRDDLIKKDPKKYAKIISQINDSLKNELMLNKVMLSKDQYMKFIGKVGSKFPEMSKIMRETFPNGKIDNEIMSGEIVFSVRWSTGPIYQLDLYSKRIKHIEDLKKLLEGL